MQFLYWLIFLMAIGIAIFAIQNSNAPSVIIKFLATRPSFLERHILRSTSDGRGKAFSGVVEPDFIE